jgi:hypothetical protein
VREFKGYCSVNPLIEHSIPVLDLVPKTVLPKTP